jgi:hypothetical protein
MYATITKVQPVNSLSYSFIIQPTRTGISK